MKGTSWLKVLTRVKSVSMLFRGVLTTAPANVPILLAHAHALSRTTSAPVSSLLAPVDKAQATPWPNEMNMRQGLLFQLEGSMSGMGSTGVVGTGKFDSG